MAVVFIGTKNWSLAQAVLCAILGFVNTWTRERSIPRATGAAALGIAISLVITSVFASYLPR